MKRSISDKLKAYPVLSVNGGTYSIWKCPIVIDESFKRIFLNNMFDCWHTHFRV